MEMIEQYEVAFNEFKAEYPLNDTQNKENKPELTQPRLRLDVENIRRFRGTHSLDLTKDFTLLYAPNGVGKSTLTECLELLKFGDVSRTGLSSVSREFRLDKDLPSRGVDAKDVSIALTSNTASGEQKYSFDFVSQSEGRPKLPVTVVSRNTIRNSVTAKDKERFAQLLGIAQIPGLSESYDNLNRMYESAKSACKTLESDAERLKHSLDNVGLVLEEVDRNAINPDVKERQQHIEDLKHKADRFGKQAEAFNAVIREFDALEFITEPVEVQKPTAPLNSAVPISSLEKVIRSVNPGETCPICQEITLGPEHLQRALSKIEENQNYIDAVRNYEKYEEQVAKRRQFECRFEEACSRGLALFQAEEGAGQSEDAAVECLKTTHFESETTFDEQKQEILSRLSEAADRNSQGAERLRETATKVADADDIKLKAIWENLGENDLDRNSRLDRLKAAKALGARLSELREESKNYFSTILLTRLEPIREDIVSWWNLLRPAETDFDFSVKVSTTTKTPQVRFTCTPVGQSTKKTRAQNAIAVMSDSQLDVLSLAITLASHCSDYPDGLVWLDDPTDMFDDLTQNAFCGKALPRLVESGAKVVLATHSKHIVEKVWTSVAEKRFGNSDDELAGKSFGDSILQVNIEAADGPAGERSCSRFVPFDVASIKGDVERAIDEAKAGGGLWSVGQRIRVANLVRRYAEAILASLLDVLEQVCARPPYRSNIKLSDDKATLKSYLDGVLTMTEKMRSVLAYLEQQNRSGGPLQSIVNQVELGVDAVDGSLLNSGSHASAVVPTVSELKDIKKKMEIHLWKKPCRVHGSDLVVPEVFLSLLEGGKYYTEFQEALQSLAND